MNPDTITISAGPRMRTALLLAIVADTFQIVFSPLFFEGAASPADDILDLCMAGVLSYLLGWNWEFLPSFLAKLVPGVDLVPLWTLAVANVYRRSKRLAVTVEGSVGNATETPKEPSRLRVPYSKPSASIADDSLPRPMRTPMDPRL